MLDGTLALACAELPSSVAGRVQSSQMNALLTLQLQVLQGRRKRGGWGANRPIPPKLKPTHPLPLAVVNFRLARCAGLFGGSLCSTFVVVATLDTKHMILVTFPEVETQISL